MNKEIQVKDLSNEKLYPNYTLDREINVVNLIQENNNYQELKKEIEEVNSQINYKDNFNNKSIFSVITLFLILLLPISTFFTLSVLLINKEFSKQEIVLERGYERVIKEVDRYKEQLLLGEAKEEEIYIKITEGDKIKNELIEHQNSHNKSKEIFKWVFVILMSVFLLDRFIVYIAIRESKKECVILRKKRDDLNKEKNLHKNNYNYYFKLVSNSDRGEYLIDILNNMYLSRYQVLNKLNKKTIKASYCSCQDYILSINIDENILMTCKGDEQVKGVRNNTNIFKKNFKTMK